MCHSSMSVPTVTYESCSRIAHLTSWQLQAAGPGKAIVSGEAKRLRFAVKGYDALRSWDVYWTGRQVSCPQHHPSCLSCSTDMPSCSL